MAAPATPPPAPARCPRYFELSMRLVDAARAIAAGGGEEARELEEEVLATFRAHMEVCRRCRAWWDATADLGHYNPPKDVE